MFFGHWLEIMVLLVVALLVFGPKRMIEMGSSFGKAFRELREATKDVSWTNLMTGGDPEPEKQTTLSKLSQLSQSLSESATPTQTPPASPNMPAAPIVETTTVEPVDTSHLD